jgi:hypothetical protein
MLLLSPLKSISENLRSMQYHLMTYHISSLKNNSENSRKSHHPTSHFLLKNNSKNSRKMYYNSLKVINDEFSQHASMPLHLTSYHISPLKNNYENSRKIYFSNYSINRRETKM